MNSEETLKTLDLYSLMCGGNAYSISHYCMQVCVQIIMSDNAYSDIICKFKKESEAKRISPPSLPSKINSKQLRASMCNVQVCMYCMYYVTMRYTLYVTITKTQDYTTMY